MDMFTYYNTHCKLPVICKQLHNSVDQAEF